MSAWKVVSAIGPNLLPRIRIIARDLEDAIHQLHSSESRNPNSISAGEVIVVGAGNSGAQIALEKLASR